MSDGLKLFGLEIIKASKAEKEPVSFVAPANEDDGGFSVGAGGHFGQYLDLEAGAAGTEKELIIVYRELAKQPEVDAAIDDIVGEAISTVESSTPVRLILDDLDQPNRIKKLITDEFDVITRLLNFNMNATDIFRRWYEDGRLYYHKIIDQSNPKKGIIEVRPIDPTKIRKVKEVEKKHDSNTGVEVITKTNEFFIYDDAGSNSAASAGLKISPDAITYITSGLVDSARARVIGYLHKAIKPANQLRALEDSLVIYRISRAPERRIFYIDVGNLPKGKAEDYLQTIMSKYRSKMVYDASTGALQSENKHMSMLEDFWLPRREGGRGTEISTLPGGDNLGNIDDVLYFQKKLYKSMNVPFTRLSSDEQSAFSLGRSSEITRDELKYQKFISKLRHKFSRLFFDMLKTQLILKGIVNEQEWRTISQDMQVDFIKDSYFTELKNSEILRERIGALSDIDEYVGRYYSAAWVRKNVLMQTDEEIEQIKSEIEAEGGNDEE